MRKPLPPLPRKAKPLPPTPTRPLPKPSEMRAVETAPRSHEPTSPRELAQPLPEKPVDEPLAKETETILSTPEQKLTKRPSLTALVPVTETTTPLVPVAAKIAKPASPPDPRVLEIIEASAGYFRPTRALQIMPSSGFGPTMKSNIGAFGTFMRAHPGVGETLKDQKVGFVFRSKDHYLEGFGGAALMNDNKIHISDKIMNLSQVYFMRTVVHEMGHGSLQNLLFAKKPGSDQLEARNQDGRDFNDAWTTLAKPENQKYFFTTDLDDPRGGAAPATYGVGRQAYLAKDVNEFTAESFMHMAIERNGLNAHVTALLKDDRVPAEVKDAWKKAKGVLDRYQDVLLKPKWIRADPRGTH